jgi:hypothetical protein
VMKVRADRMALVRGIVDGLTDTELERICTRAPAPGYPEESRSIGDCLGVVMEEECEHHRYAVRDLAVLEARYSPVTNAKNARGGERGASGARLERAEHWRDAHRPSE